MQVADQVVRGPGRFRCARAILLTAAQRSGLVFITWLGQESLNRGTRRESHRHSGYRKLVTNPIQWSTGRE